MSSVPEISQGQRSARRRTRYKVRFWNKDGEGVGFTNEVSATSMFIETRKLWSAGTRLHLEIAVDDAHPFLAEAEVVRVVKVQVAVAGVATDGIGVRLVAWSEAARLSGPPEAGPELSVDLCDKERLRRVLHEELGRGGLFVETHATPPMDSEVSVTFILPAPYESIEIPTRVVHINTQPAGVGLQVFDHQAVRRRLIAMLTPEAVPLETEHALAQGNRLELSITARGQPVLARCKIEGIEPAGAAVQTAPTLRVLDAPAKPAPPPPAELAQATAEALRALASTLAKPAK